ncbi:MAG: hypothetical protein H7A52_01570 [Akkermansiaceae bacterium]|nr:hypothetical protein [Akkermansiaceae bacterium]
MKTVTEKLSAFAVLFAAALLVAGPHPASADTIKLKSGETLEGRITFEAADSIKLEVQLSASIKETKTILKTDILEMTRTSPEELAFGEVKKKLPTPSLLKPSDYQSLIEAGPTAFLRTYPASKHKSEVEKILKELEDEKDKVERGFVKLEGEWITPQRQLEFATLTEARKLNLVMRLIAGQANYIGALRNFETLEEQYFGTPGFAEAIPTAEQLLPAYGQRLTSLLQSVEYRNQKYEEDKKLLDEVALAQVENARKREEAQHAAVVEREKAAGIKWLSVNQNSKSSLEEAISQVKSEIERLKSYDKAALKEQSDKLVAADEMISEGKLDEADAAIKEALTITTASASSSKDKSTGGKRSSSKSSGPKKASTYAAALAQKISEKRLAIADAKKQEEADKKGAAAAAEIAKGAGLPTADQIAAANEPAKETPEGEKKDIGASLTELMAQNATTSGAKKEETPKSSGKSQSVSSKKKSTKEEKDEEDEEEDDAKEKPRRSSGGGGGISFTTIMQIVAGLLVLTIVVMKLTGMGGKKG